MTREERLRSEDMGGYYRVAADNRDLNYDKFVVKGEVHTMADDSYTSHNTNRLDVEGTVKKILTTEYVRNALKEMEAEQKGMKILVTGAKGFVGRNLCENLKNLRDGKDRTRPALTVDEVFEYDLDTPPAELDKFCAEAEFCL